ncbi:hypothetical protein HJFPF1_07830 [Paramyrothecium foliicola]|nr:hypothetical protein HJFPF1_07830 [Paramyrothecium foliicola]
MRWSTRNQSTLCKLMGWPVNDETVPANRHTASQREQDGMLLPSSGHGECCPPAQLSSHRVCSAMEILMTRELSREIVTWPIHDVPVEIFELITSYLSRSEVKALRLVCREFENKVSGQYFRNVVVPFRSELYGNLTVEGEGGVRCSTSNLFTNGMRIFESFGSHIRRFALSLEIDEESLAYPPIKPVQQAVPAFWGVYRWPHDSYHRYTDLEGIEQTADEYQGLKEALRHLVNVNNLGLCCDAGLGYLLGPDNARPGRGAALHHPVFAMRDWREDQVHATNPTHPIVTVADFNEVTRRDKSGSVCSPTRFKRMILETMLSEAGFEGESELDEAINIMLETEGTSLTNIDVDERQAAMCSFERVSQTAEAPTSQNTNRYPLIPTNLTRAQRELLLELEWAHRAMIQSYVISLIDIAGEGCFKNLTTLTIAKIPSSHVHIFNRQELWSGLKSLKNVSLGVLADWRRVSKSSLGSIDDKLISPVEAVAKVFKLLHAYIGPQHHIESLHFEWICGGEFAPSAYQRNAFVLPAPIIEAGELMARPSIAKEHPEQLLRLPFIRHLSLKNCWSSPQVLFHTVRQMALASLEKLELETVSLCGPPSTSPQLSLQHLHIQNPNHGPGAPAAPAILTLFNPPATQQPTGGPTPTFTPTNAIVTWPQIPEDPAERYIQPQLMSWSGILDHFSPSVKARDIQAPYSEREDPPIKTWEHNLNMAAPFVSRFKELHADEMRYGLKCVSLKSCGYVLIDLPYINARATLPDDTQATMSGTNPNGLDMGQLMQTCKDKLCGRILAYVRPPEQHNLETTFGLRTGWDGIYDESVCEAAMNDGVECPGMGRFTGTLVAIEDSSCSNTLAGYLSDTTVGGSDNLSDYELKV